MARTFTQWLRIVCRTTLYVCLALVFVIIYCNVRIETYANKRLYDKVEEVPHRHAAVLLGTTPKTKRGNTNKFFTYRIDACVALYNAGKVDRIIVSGDNHRRNYNEPEAMRKALIEKGIPKEVIFLDYAGFRTLDSVVRAKEIFCQNSYTLVSQRFHNQRAVFIAGKKKIDAIGYNAKDPGLPYGKKTKLREVFARCKVFLDLMVGKQPYFLGEQIDIR